MKKFDLPLNWKALAGIKKPLNESLEADETNDERIKALHKADQVIHPVENQWHYKIMTKYGYEPKTPTGKGFVRSYMYENSKSGHKMKVTTGASADYWEDPETGSSDYWAKLEPYLMVQAKKERDKS